MVLPPLPVELARVAENVPFFTIYGKRKRDSTAADSTVADSTAADTSAVDVYKADGKPVPGSTPVKHQTKGVESNENGIDSIRNDTGSGSNGRGFHETEPRQDSFNAFDLENLLKMPLGKLSGEEIPMNFHTQSAGDFICEAADQVIAEPQNSNLQYLVDEDHTPHHVYEKAYQLLNARASGNGGGPLAQASQQLIGHSLDSPFEQADHTRGMFSHNRSPSEEAFLRAALPSNLLTQQQPQAISFRSVPADMPSAPVTQPLAQASAPAPITVTCNPSKGPFIYHVPPAAIMEKPYITEVPFKSQPPAGPLTQTSIYLFAKRLSDSGALGFDLPADPNSLFDIIGDEVRNKIFTLTQPIEWNGVPPAYVVAFRACPITYKSIMTLRSKLATFTLHEGNKWSLDKMSLKVLSQIKKLEIAVCTCNMATGDSDIFCAPSSIFHYFSNPETHPVELKSITIFPSSIFDSLPRSSRLSTYPLRVPGTPKHDCKLALTQLKRFTTLFPHFLTPFKCLTEVKVFVCIGSRQDKTELEKMARNIGKVLKLLPKIKVMWKDRKFWVVRLWWSVEGKRVENGKRGMDWMEVAEKVLPFEDKDLSAMLDWAAEWKCGVRGE